MSYELCGEGNLRITTCVKPEGSRLLVCNPCYGEHAACLLIVLGRLVVTARCDACGPTATRGISWGEAWGLARCARERTSRLEDRRAIIPLDVLT